MVLVFGMIIYGRMKSLMKGRPCGDSNLKRHRHQNDYYPLHHNHMFDPLE